MSRMARLTRDFVLVQAGPAQLVERGIRGFRGPVFLNPVKGLDRNPEQVASLIAHHHEFRVGPENVEAL